MKQSLVMDLKLKKELGLQFTLMQRPTLADDATVFSAKLKAVLLTLKHVTKSQNDKSIIFFDTVLKPSCIKTSLGYFNLKVVAIDLFDIV